MNKLPKYIFLTYIGIFAILTVLGFITTIINFNSIVSVLYVSFDMLMFIPVIIGSVLYTLKIRTASSGEWKAFLVLFAVYIPISYLLFFRIDNPLTVSTTVVDLIVGEIMMSPFYFAVYRYAFEFLPQNSKVKK